MRILGLLVNLGWGWLLAVLRAGVYHLTNTTKQRMHAVGMPSGQFFHFKFDAGLHAKRVVERTHLIAQLLNLEWVNLAGLAHSTILAQSGSQRFITKEVVA